jgi:hypothetical protein
MDTRYDGARQTQVSTQPNLRNMPLVLSAQPIKAVLCCARDHERFLFNPERGAQTWWGDPSSKEGQNYALSTLAPPSVQTIKYEQTQDQKQGLTAEASS